MIDKEMAIKIVNKIGSYGDIVLRSDMGEVAKFIDYQDKEIERLNNIIEDLERYIEESKYLASGVLEFKGVAYMFYYNKTDDLLDKIQELKGSDKE